MNSIGTWFGPEKSPMFYQKFLSTALILHVIFEIEQDLLFTIKLKTIVLVDTSAINMILDECEFVARGNGR